MNKSKPNSDLGLGQFGYAWRRVGPKWQTGIATRHRSDGRPRVICELVVHFEGLSYDFAHWRLLNMEFSLQPREDVDELPLVCIGRERWRNEARNDTRTGFECDGDVAPMLGGECLTLALGNGQFAVECSRWKASLVYPRVKRALSEPIAVSPVLRGWIGGIAMCDGDEACIAYSSSGSGPYGEIIVDDATQVTYIFPRDVT